MITALAILAAASPGLQVGEAFAAFEPYHVTGPYAGGNMCPVCEYMMLPMVFMWTDPTDAAILPVATTIQASITKHGTKALKAFVLDINRSRKDKESVQALTKLAASEPWKAVPNVWLLSRPNKLQAVTKDHALLPWDKYRSITYLVRGRKVVAKFVDLSSKEEDQAKLGEAIEAMMASKS